MKHMNRKGRFDVDKPGVHALEESEQERFDHLAELIQMHHRPWLASSYQTAEAAEMKEDEGGDEEEDSEGPGGITDMDYAHSISPSERESVGPNRATQPAPGLRGKM
ncbi:hypothetical protein INR49_029133 [Caranx melampygus]|nr:hypothetical protein INR49_029133 [Caranx melampygus]